MINPDRPSFKNYINIEYVKDIDRAKFISDNNTIVIGSKNLTFEGIAHEFAHYLEYNNPKMLLNSMAYLNQRKISDINIKLKDFIKDCDDDELAYKTDFNFDNKNHTDKYISKIYEDATEIMSVGIQSMFNNNMRTTIKEKDKELFNFIIANLKGDI